MGKMGTPAAPDGKDMVIDGCRVHLDFHSLPDGRWIVNGTTRCGVGQNNTEQSFRSRSL